MRKYIFSLLTLLPLFLRAQNRPDSSVVTEQRDITDVLHRLFKRKHPSAKKIGDSLIVRPTFSGLPAIGYTLTTRLAATISGNMAFRVDSSAKLSVVTASAAYTQNKQFTVPVESNIWTKNSRFNLLGDYRFYKYPQDTYGLGSNTPIQNDELLDYYFFRFAEIVQTHIISDLYAGVGYMFEYQWDIDDEGLPNGQVSDYRRYDTANSTRASGFILNAVFDSRDNAIDPSGGWYSSVQYRDNLPVLGSQRHWQSIILDNRKYFVVPARSGNILAFWSYDWLVIQGKPPYLDLPSTTWDQYSNTGRGYIQGRFRGTNMVYLETEYRMSLTSDGLVGAVAFLNAESLSAEPRSKLQSVQPGFGGGLRVRLNKKSKTNVCIDYGFGNQGSHGLFINIGEMF